MSTSTSLNELLTDSWGSVTIGFIILLLSILFIYFTRAFTSKAKTVVILGLNEAGKTVLFSKLINKSWFSSIHIRCGNWKRFWISLSHCSNDTEVSLPCERLLGYQTTGILGYWATRLVGYQTTVHVPFFFVFNADWRNCQSLFVRFYVARAVVGNNSLFGLFFTKSCR